jgi:hypothetical protein
VRRREAGDLGDVGLLEGRELAVAASSISASAEGSDDSRPTPSRFLCPGRPRADRPMGVAVKLESTKEERAGAQPLRQITMRLKDVREHEP